MNHHAMILDCTLRDGAYLVDKTFGERNIQGIVEGLVRARVDCIEIGFFQNEGFGEGKTVFRNSLDAKKYVPTDKQGALFTVLADCSRYSVSNLDECDGTSIDAIRECFFKTERREAIENCRVIKKKGYKCFVQPVDMLGYSDSELISLIDDINKVEPYCFSIVDTFGSMYQDDLHRVFEIVHHNLISSCKVGFHSHNNMQMSNALSQEFIRMSYGKREVVVDGTISGMGRGAGNTPTELIAQYMVSQRGYNYDIDSILDIIDDYMDNIKSRCTWGYSTPYFLAGSYGAHVNNIAYLTGKNSIRSKDIRYILNGIGVDSRKRYDYDLLEKTYFDYLSADIDDSFSMEYLKKELSGHNILLLVPGSTIRTEVNRIHEYINKKNPIVIAINFVHEDITADYVYMSNIRRYSYWKNSSRFIVNKKIIASNIKRLPDDDKEIIVSFNKLIKCGFEYADNSTLLLLRLLDMFDVLNIGIAGFDGYDTEAGGNYVTSDLELSNVRDNPIRLNEQISKMLEDYCSTRNSKSSIEFVTASRFEKCFTDNK